MRSHSTDSIIPALPLIILSHSATVTEESLQAGSPSPCNASIKSNPQIKQGLLKVIN
jgi:hypothetical protein